MLSDGPGHGACFGGGSCGIRYICNIYIMQHILHYTTFYSLSLSFCSRSIRQVCRRIQAWMERCDERLQRFSALSETLEEHRGDTQQSVLKMEVSWLFFHPKPGREFCLRLFCRFGFGLSKGFEFLEGI